MASSVTGSIDRIWAVSIFAEDLSEICFWQCKNLDQTVWVGRSGRWIRSSIASADPASRAYSTRRKHLYHATLTSLLVLPCLESQLLLRLRYPGWSRWFMDWAPDRWRACDDRFCSIFGVVGRPWWPDVFDCSGSGERGASGWIRWCCIGLVPARVKNAVALCGRVCCFGCVF